jgi:two-component system sensor histidine kinase DegS
MQTMIASDLLSKGRIEESQQELIELEKTLARLYLNTREELFNLRAYLDRGRNFVTALQEYLNDYSRYYQMATQLHIYDIQATQLSERAALQIEWIIKEALSNARKHSEAKKAEIIFRYEADQAVIAIVDDGKGFNPDDLDDTDSHHSGLQIMQERAQSIDGRLEIESQPDSGTRITIYVPKGI